VLFVSAILLKIAKAVRARVFYCAQGGLRKSLFAYLAGVVEIAPRSLARAGRIISPISAGPHSNALVAKKSTSQPHTSALFALSSQSDASRLFFHSVLIHFAFVNRDAHLVAKTVKGSSRAAVQV
jgi:hypothetical protein